jgi:hypothetical protein
VGVSNRMSVASTAANPRYAGPLRILRPAVSAILPAGQSRSRWTTAAIVKPTPDHVDARADLLHTEHGTRLNLMPWSPPSAKPP